MARRRRPDAPVWRFYVERTEWRSGKFDRQLRGVADDQARWMWMARDSGAIFAPYAGGFDLFPANEQELVALKAEFSSWLSGRPDGL